MHQPANSVRCGHPDYRAIIALGPAVESLLLRDLETNCCHWFNGLAALTAADAGDFAAMAAAWHRWARSAEYRW